MELSHKNTNGKATLRDVAKVANVSSTTVSRVLNDGPNVSNVIKEKVQTAIDQLNYTPSPAARALNTGRTHTVGALIPTLDHAIFAKFLDAVEKSLTSYNLNLVISTTGEDPDVEARHAKDLLNMGAEALIVSGKKRSLEFDNIIKRRPVPVIITSYHTLDAIYPTIGYDNVAISKIALDHLFERGYRSIAVIHGPTKNNDRTASRLKGIELDNRFENISYHEVEMSFGGACTATSKILAQNPRPTAILCLSDVLALGAMFELGRHNISIPNEMAVMGYDNLAWSAHSNPPLTTIELSVATMGKKVADQINNCLNEGEHITSEALKGRLIVREST